MRAGPAPSPAPLPHHRCRTLTQSQMQSLTREGLGALGPHVARMAEVEVRERGGLLHEGPHPPA